MLQWLKWWLGYGKDQQEQREKQIEPTYAPQELENTKAKGGNQ